MKVFKIQLPDLSNTTQIFLFKQMYSNSPTLLMAKIQLLALLFLSVKGDGGDQNFIKTLMGEFFSIEILVEGTKRGIHCFVVVQ